MIVRCLRHHIGFSERSVLSRTLPSVTISFWREPSAEELSAAVFRAHPRVAVTSKRNQMAATAPRSFVSLNRVDYRTKIDLITDFLIEYFNLVDNTTVFVAKRRKKKTGGTNNKIANIFLKTVFTYQYGAKALSARCVFVASIFQHQGIRKHGVRPRQLLCCRRPRWFSTSDFCFISQGIRWVHTTLSHGKCDRNCAIFNIQLLKNFSYVVSACYWYFL